jgi:hypothetical protein
VFLVFLLIMCVVGPLIFLAIGAAAGILVMGAALVAFFIIMLIKGEPLSGDDDDSQPSPQTPGMMLRYYKIGACAIAALLIALSIPLLLKWVPKNQLYGFRVPSSLNGSNARWFHVNEVAGAAGIVAGVLAIVFALLIVDRFGLSEAGKIRAVLIATVALILTAVIPPYFAH